MYCCVFGFFHLMPKAQVLCSQGWLENSGTWIKKLWETLICTGGQYAFWDKDTLEPSWNEIA